MSSTTSLPSARTTAALVSAAALAAALGLSGSALGAVTGTGPLQPPLGACSGAACPGDFPPPHNGDFPGRDASINVFVGADYLARARAAEAEGRIVALGDLTIDKTGGGAFNMGVVGVGSRVPPPNGTDHVAVGGKVTVAAGDELLIGGSDSKNLAWGNLRHGGTLTGATDIAAPGTAIQDSTVRTTYAPLRAVIEGRSTCAAEATATGTVTVTSSDATFTGDGSSALQVFDVPGNLGGAGAIGLTFTGIPAGATVLVNMLGATPTINTYTGTGIAGDPTTDLGPRLMWNFPHATSATITGGAQFQGSILAGNPSGTTTLSTPGVNGRVYLAGGLIQEGGGGYEIHAYPFTGDLPICNAAPAPTPTAPTPTPTASTATPTPTHSATPTPTRTTPAPTTSRHTGAPSLHSGTPGPELADTGTRATAELWIPAAALVSGATLLLLLRRRRNGRHS